jgi:hypothetical protein
VTIEHVNATYEGIPDSELAIVQFLTEDPVPTVAPIRRAG